MGHQSVCVQRQREHEEGGEDRSEQDLAGRTTGSQSYDKNKHKSRVSLSCEPTHLR